MSASRDIIRRRRHRRRSLLDREHATRRNRGLMIVAGILLSFVFVGFSIAAAATMYAMQRYDAIAETVVPAEQLIEEFSRGGAKIYDRNGVFLYEFVDRFGGLRRPVPIHEISEEVIRATIATEDANFYENNGLNMRGLMRAGVENFTPFLGNTEFLEGSGGSSITQQLAKNIYIPPEERTERSMDRKVQEMVIAVELTERYSKDQILEWYLNSISYGGIYVGIQAAAEGYFGKSASQLNLAEAALLAGIPQSPADYYPMSAANYDAENHSLAPAGLAKARQGEVLDLMVHHGVITQTEADNARNAEINFVQQEFEIEAAHFVLRVADEITARWGERALYDLGLEVTTTLDLELNYIAEEILEHNIVEYGEAADLHNGALVALDPHTGQILTYVGSRDYHNDEIQGRNDNASARNSPGSTLKPFTYMTALTEGWGTGTAIMDTPVTFQSGSDGGTFTPRNPGTGFQGPVPVSIALGNSFNIPANKTMAWAGVDDVISMLKRVGYTTLDNPGGYGVALTTGGGEITLFDQTYAYSVLATNGVMRGQEPFISGPLEPGERELEPVSLLKVVAQGGEVLYEFEEPEERQVVPPAYPYMISSILNDPQNTCITYGACGALALPNGYPSAAKTGTSEPFEEIGSIGETWTMGYTPELVAGTWAGNADNSRIYGISSTSVSSRAWREFMVAAIDYLGLPATEFTRPDGVVDVEVCWPSGKLPSAACPDERRYTSMFAAEVMPGSPEANPDAYDTWWREVEIDWRTGRPADSNTPAEFIEEGIRLVFPEDEIQGWGGLADWAARNEASQFLGGTSTDEGGGSLLAQIMSPSANQVLSGQVDIRGRADSPDLERWHLEYGRDDSWNTIGSGDDDVSDGVLAQWDTFSVEDGEYTLRLILEDDELGQQLFQIPVTVRNAGVQQPGPGEPGEPGGPGGPTTPGTGTVVIANPSEGNVVSGQIAIVGTADTNGFVGYNLQVGAGTQPASWTSINSGTSEVLNDVVGAWNTSEYPDGVYTIRLLVIDQFFLNNEFRVTVTVDNSGGGGNGGDGNGNGGNGNGNGNDDQQPVQEPEADENDDG